MKGKSLHYAFVVQTVGLFSLVGGLGFGRFAYALILPSMQRDFQTSYTEMGSIATSNAVAYMISALVCGFLANHFGGRLVVSSALFLCSAGLAGTALSNNFLEAAAGQFLCGLGTGGVVGPVYSLVGPWFVEKKRGTAMGIIQAGSGAGILIGGVIVPPLLALGTGPNWHFVWLVLSVLVFLIALSATFLIRNNPSEKNLSPFGSSEEHLNNLPKPASPTSRSRAFTVFRMLSIWHLGLIFCCFGISYVVYTIFFGAFLQNNGLSNQETGFIWGLAGVFSTGGSILWGKVADRKGGKFALISICLVQGSALVLLGLSHDRPGFYTGAVIYGLALFGMPVAISLLTTQFSGPDRAAAALGMVILFFSVGQIAGPLLAGWLKDVTGSLALPFLIAAGIAWFGALLSTLIKSPSFYKQ